MKESQGQRGFALITMLVLLALLMALLLTHFSLTWIEMATTNTLLSRYGPKLGQLEKPGDRYSALPVRGNTCNGNSGTSTKNAIKLSTRNR